MIVEVNKGGKKVLTNIVVPKFHELVLDSSLPKGYMFKRIEKNAVEEPKKKVVAKAAPKKRGRPKKVTK